MLVIDILGPPQTRIINLYRPHNPKQMPELTFFCNQIMKLDELITTSTIILGDFNLDLNKEQTCTYQKKAYFTMMKNVLGHHGLDQLVTEDTWSRTVNGIKLSSRIDHVYTTVKNRVDTLELVNNAFSDHEMVQFNLSNVKVTRPEERIWKRNWRKYSKEALQEELSKTDWNSEIKDSQNYYNVLENKLIKIARAAKLANLS